MMIPILHNYFRVQFFTVYGERLRMLQLRSGKVFSSMREKVVDVDLYNCRFKIGAFEKNTIIYCSLFCKRLVSGVLFEYTGIR